MTRLQTTVGTPQSCHPTRRADSDGRSAPQVRQKRTDLYQVDTYRIKSEKTKPRLHDLKINDSKNIWRCALEVIVEYEVQVVLCAVACVSYCVLLRACKSCCGLLCSCRVGGFRAQGSRFRVQGLGFKV